MFFKFKDVISKEEINILLKKKGEIDIAILICCGQGCSGLTVINRITNLFSLTH